MFYLLHYKNKLLLSTIFLLVCILFGCLPGEKEFFLGEDAKPQKIEPPPGMAIITAEAQGMDRAEIVGIDRIEVVGEYHEVTPGPHDVYIIAEDASWGCGEVRWICEDVCAIKGEITSILILFSDYTEPCLPDCNPEPAVSRADCIEIASDSDCDFDNIIPVPWEFKYINDKGKINDLLNTNSYRDKIINDRSLAFHRLMLKASESAHYDINKSPHHTWPEAELIVPHTLEWRDGYIRIVKNPLAQPLSWEKSIPNEAIGQVRGEIQSEILTSLYGKEVVARLNLATFIITVAEHAMEGQKALDLLELFQVDPHQVRVLAQEQAIKEIISDLSKKMARGGPEATSLDFYLHNLLKRAEIILLHNTQVMRKRGCLPTSDHPVIKP